MKRYHLFSECEPEMVEFDGGKWVRYEDAQAEIDRLIGRVTYFERRVEGWEFIADLYEKDYNELKDLNEGLEKIVKARRSEEIKDHDENFYNTREAQREKKYATDHPDKSPNQSWGDYWKGY